MEFEATFRAALWRWDARRTDSWFFVTVPEAESADLRALPIPPRGFGSIPVEASIGSSQWRTSVFPDAASGCYVLPMKAAVRRKEGLDEGDEPSITVRLARD